MSDQTVETDLVLAAQDLVTLDRRIADARAELEALRAARAERQAFLERFAPTGAVFEADTHWVRVGATRTSRAVDALRCDELREQLVDAGVGRMSDPVYLVPTIAAIEAAQGALLARGINPSELIRPAGEPAPKLTLVVKDAAA
jgi:hypothetical protein